MYAINLTNEGRIFRVTEERFADSEAIIVETLPEGDPNDYLYIDGKYVYSECQWKKEQESAIAAAQERAEKLQELLDGLESYQRDVNLAITELYES